MKYLMKVNLENSKTLVLNSIGKVFTHYSYMSFIYKVMKKLETKVQFKSLVLTLDYNEYYSK